MILRKGADKNERAKTQSLRTQWIRYKISIPKGRRLRVLIYARYSTDEQNPRSIDDQVLYCKRLLKALGITDYAITVLFDEGVSGEKLLRHGIDQVRKGIDAKDWDLILCEDCGRLFRNAHACVELVGDAVDAGIRVMCINDEVDTADEEYWEDRLYEAARHHERSNKFASRRSKRALEALWEMGAAIGLLKPGYLRTVPAAQSEVDEEGPSFDQIDPAQAPIIKEAYERIAAQHSLWSVADWLTGIGFKKASNSRKSAWTDRNVLDLIRRTDYRGFETYRNKCSKRARKTGTKLQRQNDPTEVLSRDMPHHRIVSDSLWNAANRAITARAPNCNIPQGDDHSLARIPRNSRGPLSKVLYCGCCGRKMHADSGDKCAYRCSGVQQQTCWNKASAHRKITHQAISKAISEHLRDPDDIVDHLCQRAAQLLGDSHQRDTRRAELLREKGELKCAIENLNNAIEQAKGSLETTIERLCQREGRLAEVQGELDSLTARDESWAPPTIQEITKAIAEWIDRLQAMDRGVCDDLELLVGRVKAVPYQQFGTSKVVLRAQFELRLAAFLPARTRAVLAGLLDDSVYTRFEQRTLLVNLFEPSTCPEHGSAALALNQQQGMNPTAIGKALGITKRQADLALQYGRKLRAANLQDPFIELTEPPAKASRWRNRRPPSLVVSAATLEERPAPMPLLPTHGELLASTD